MPSALEYLDEAPETNTRPSAMEFLDAPEERPSASKFLDAPDAPPVALAAPLASPAPASEQIGAPMMSPESEAAAMFAPKEPAGYQPRVAEDLAAFGKDILPAKVWEKGGELVSQMTPKALSDARNVLALGAAANEGAISPDRMMELMGEPSAPPTGVEKVVAGGIKGVNESTLGLARFFNTPKGAMTLGLSAVPSGFQRAAAAYFAWEMGSQFPEQAKELSDAIETGDPERITQTSAKLGINALFVKSAATHGLTATPPPAGVQAIDQMLRNPDVEVTAQDIRFGDQSRTETRNVAESPEAIAARNAGLNRTAEELSKEVKPNEETQGQEVLTTTPPLAEPAAAIPNDKQLSRIQNLEMLVSNALAKKGVENPDFARLSVVEGRDITPDNYEAGLQKMLDALNANKLPSENPLQSLPEPAAVVPEAATSPTAPEVKAPVVEPTPPAPASPAAETEPGGPRPRSWPWMPMAKAAASKPEPAPVPPKAEAAAPVESIGSFTANTKDSVGNWVKSTVQVLSIGEPVKMARPSSDGRWQVSFEAPSTLGKTGRQTRTINFFKKADALNWIDEVKASKAESNAGLKATVGTVSEPPSKETNSDALGSTPSKPASPPSIASPPITDAVAPKPEPSPVLQERASKEGAGVGEAGATAAPPLTPIPGVTSLTPKSQRKIISDLAKGLNVPIRFGRLTTNRFAGYYKTVANLIGSKRANNVPIVTHEAGHRLDAAFKLSSDPTVSAEFDRLGDPATPGSMSSWTKSKSKSYKMGEGMAEFTRLWLTDPARAKAEAPNANRLFEEQLNANKDFGDTMRQAQEDIRVWRTSSEQARLRSHISTGENPNKTRYTLSQLTRDLQDDLHIARLAMDDARRGSAANIPPSQDMYLLARNLRGSYGMADTFIREGVTDFKTKAVNMGTSFEDALKPVSGRIADFTDWIVAKRAQELHAKGKETGLLDSDVQAVAAKFDSDPAFQKAFDDVKKWNDALLQYAVDSGMITPETAQAMRSMNHDYVPFHRVFEVGAGEKPAESSSGTGRGLNLGSPGSLKRQKGSARDIINPLETMVKNAYTIITASEKSAIHRTLADLTKIQDMGKWVERVATPKEKVQFELESIRKQLDDAGADTTMIPDDLLLSFWKQSQRTPYGENIIRIIRDGKPELYRLNEDLYNTFHALDAEAAGTILKIVSEPAQWLRAGVTLEPGFNLANALRDTVGAAVLSKYGAVPFSTTIRGFAAMIGNKKLIAEWAASGGKSAVESAFFDRTQMQRYLARKISKDLTPAERATIWVKSPLTALRAMSSAFEEATRIGEYQIALKQLLKEEMPEGDARRLAAFESRDRQDFAMGGAKTKALRRMTPFWNAGLQANVRLLRAFKERPLQTMLKGMAFITIPKLIEQSINWNDDDYWDRPQWERDAFFMFPMGKSEDGHTRFLRIPVPFELGAIFASVPGRILQYGKRHDPEAVKGALGVVAKQAIPNPIPTPVSLVYENFLSGPQGWSVFRGRPIVPSSMKDLPPDMQFTEQTSSTAKKLGATFNFAPMKIDNMIESMSGGIGKLVTGRQLPGSRFVSNPLATSNQPVEDFYNKITLMEEEAQRKKAGQSPKVDISALPAMRRVRAEISDLRTQARKSTSEVEKMRLQNLIYEKAKRAMQGGSTPNTTQRDLIRQLTR